jgi:transcription antitermination factor NusG
MGNIDVKFAELSSEVRRFLEQSARRKAPSIVPGDGGDFETARRWHILQTEPMRERTVHKHLHEGFRVYCPMIVVIRTRGLRRAKVKDTEPMFRGYEFIRLDLRDGVGADLGKLPIILRTPGVRVDAHSFLRIDGRYATISDAAYEEICRTEWEENNPGKCANVQRMKIGDMVKILREGALAGEIAKVDRIDSQRRITLQFGAVKIKIDPHYVELT